MENFTFHLVLFLRIVVAIPTKFICMISSAAFQFTKRDNEGKGCIFQYFTIRIIYLKCLLNHLFTNGRLFVLLS
jgi:hypothetical protein